MREYKNNEEIKAHYNDGINISLVVGFLIGLFLIGFLFKTLKNGGRIEMLLMVVGKEG